MAVEPKACPTLTRGEYRYDYGDMARLTPLVKMHTLGHDFMPAPIHAGGLRYHGDAPILCNIVEEGLCDPVAYFQTECFEAAKLFMQTEGFLPAPETSHAIKGALRPPRPPVRTMSSSSCTPVTACSTWLPTTPSIRGC